MKKKIFLRFFTVTLVAVLAMFAFGVAAVNVNANALGEERLTEETRLVCSFVEDEDDFAKFAKYENDDAFRVTIIGVDGDVLYESDTHSPLENHAEREEIRYALGGEPRTVKRYSETFGCDMTYYAMKTALLSGEEIVVRLAIKSSYISGYLGMALPILVAVLIVALVVSLLASSIFAKKIAAKFGGIGTSLKSLNDGDYEPIETDTREPELFAVLNEINELSESAHERMQKITEEHAKLNAVLENVSQAIVAVDARKKIVFVNQSARQLFDATSDVTGKDLVYLVEDVALCEKIASDPAESGLIEHCYQGKQLSIAVRSVKESENGTEVSRIVIITDVTSEKALQKQKSDFFANASHELKTPVTVMQGLSEILLDKEELDAASKRQVERIHKESLRLSSLIADMLKLSKLERGEEADEALFDVSLRDVCEEVLKELSFEINQKGILASVTGDAVVKADAKKMFELIENLCSNAVHYNVEKGKIQIEIREEDGVLLSVRDTGIGIEKDKIPRLCERFYRVDKSRSKKTGGTGLGLAIVKHICALYNADLSIESEVGAGTSVSVCFPKQ